MLNPEHPEPLGHPVSAFVLPAVGHVLGGARVGLLGHS